MNIRTIFRSEVAGNSLEGKVKQRVKFNWIEPKMTCLMDEQCFVPDIDGLVMYPEKCGGVGG